MIKSLKCKGKRLGLFALDVSVANLTLNASFAELSIRKKRQNTNGLLKSKVGKATRSVLLTNTYPFDLPYNLATGKTKKKIIFNTVLDDDGNKTKSIDETISAIVQQLFPRDEEHLGLLGKNRSGLL
ncbi:hypothetical protein AVEN_156922-1 [Araneus ventricosus]|uniref:Uncharacterized protein n=1 Tax=Araneus ventricosus TaxID=182803 RepID=A0A4Y2EKG8_ARAVE|nr:hypothetical protein AVEN_156922-1 [Araneus ventricosus]